MHKSNEKSTITEDGRCTFSHCALESELFKESKWMYFERYTYVLYIVLKFLDHH